MARVILRIEYDGGGHVEFCEQSLAGLSIPDLNAQAIMLAQGAYEKAVRAAGLTIQAPPEPAADEASGRAEPRAETNGRPSASARAAGRSTEKVEG